MNEEERGAWERMRIASTILLQPNLKRGARLTPQKLLPLPWDGGARTADGGRRQLSREEERERMERIRRKFGAAL